MGEMRVLNQSGDITVIWDEDDQESVDKAKAEYDRLKKDGYEFYEVAEAKGKRVKRWSKKHGKLIAAPGAQSATDKAKGKRGKAMSGGPNAQLVR